MPIVRLQIDVSGTRGEEVWSNLRHFDLAEGASMEFHPESGEMCKHPADAVHPEGESLSATIQVETMLLAQYAVAHYIEQNRVLDADVNSEYKLSGPDMDTLGAREDGPKRRTL